MSVVNNSILEDTENFLVRLLNNLPQVNIIAPTETNIIIFDDDCKLTCSIVILSFFINLSIVLLTAIVIMFEENVYTVNESMGHVEVCVILMVEIQRSIQLILITMETGLAKGT